MDLLQALIARIYKNLCLWTEADPRFSKQTKVVTFPVRKTGTNDLFTLWVYNQLTFEGVPFLFAGIEVFLFFLGRSIGVSVASTKTTS